MATGKRRDLNFTYNGAGGQNLTVSLCYDRSDTIVFAQNKWVLMYTDEAGNWLESVADFVVGTGWKTLSLTMNPDYSGIQVMYGGSSVPLVDVWSSGSFTRSTTWGAPSSVQVFWEDNSTAGGAPTDHTISLDNLSISQQTVVAKGLISGFKFYDADANGVKAYTTAEHGMAGWVINLMHSGTLVASTTTAADGSYSFQADPGNYTVAEAPLAGSWTCRTNPLTLSFTVVGGDTHANVNIGNVIVGDANGDGIVDQADYTVWYNNYGASGATWGQGDFTGEGLVDQADYTIWYNNYGSTGGNVPEPMTMAMLAIGGLAMVRRRR